jgi:hypothetical protein
MTLDLDALMGISFSYEVIGTNRGDLFATLGDDVIWSVDLADGGLLRDDVYLSLLNYSGAEKLIWLFDSPDIGSRVVFSDFNATAIVAVPEPAMLPMFLVGCTCLYRMRTRVGQSYRICPK